MSDNTQNANAFIAFLDKYLVNEWRSAPKMISLWVFLVIGLSPELYALAVQYKLVAADSGAMPQLVADLLNWLAFIGAAGRMLDQAAIAKGLKKAPAADPTDQAGA